MSWWRQLKGRVRLGEPLKKYTTFKIGGPAKFLIEPRDTQDLKLLLNLLKRYKIPFLVLGAGSNILVSDRGTKKAILRLNAPSFKKVEFKNGYLYAGAGLALSQLVRLAKEQSLSGLEFLAGIPGTVGGALAMNAGIARRNRSIGDLVKEVTVMDCRGNIKTLDREEIKFGYRHSDLTQYVILGVKIKLVHKDKTRIQDTIATYLNDRRLKQDLTSPSAGCVFKNPAGYSAGKLIDLCGLKGTRIGDARVSLRHANFILNRGKAKARDVLKLMRLIIKKVENKFHITLEPEIKIWQ